MHHEMQCFFANTEGRAGSYHICGISLLLSVLNMFSR